MVAKEALFRVLRLGDAVGVEQDCVSRVEVGAVALIRIIRRDAGRKVDFDFRKVVGTPLPDTSPMQK